MGVGVGIKAGVGIDEGGIKIMLPKDFTEINFSPDFFVLFIKK
ncbi:MAG: hypothetical protein US55_C0023G0008 [Candidatus Levybacteria bacterium GW2011_GWC2_37_7]|nr:MAG: hypothetical protein US55_C0023G0008 [Candidatus Levybacteria bacterium GW2011_GWC2_37_7]